MIRLITMLACLILLTSGTLAQQVTVGDMTATWDGCTLTQLTTATGQSYVQEQAPPTDPVMLHLKGDLQLPRGQASEQAGLPVTREYTKLTKDYGQLSNTFAAEGSDLIVTQQATADEGLYGLRWMISGVPLDWNILVPGGSGQKLDKGAPGAIFDYSYPMTWEAQFVILEAPEGNHGFWVWAEDIRGQFKNLRVIKQAKTWALVFDTQSLAPFEDKSELSSVKWHLATWQGGDWRNPAGQYRAWAQEAFDLKASADAQPKWAKEIRTLILSTMDLPTLEKLALMMDPTQTMLYLPGWRRDGYDRNYPDYTPVPEMKPFVDRAHELGFRIMLHVNYFGVDPLNPLYEKFEPYQVRNPYTKQKEWWLWERADPIIKFAYINPACKEFRDLFVSRMKELCETYDIDALHLDQTLCIYNDDNGLIDGMTMIEGNIAEHRELRAALPNVALSGEGLNEITFRDEAFAQRHVSGLDHTNGTWFRPWLDRAHPVSSYLLRPQTIINGYLGMSTPVNGQLYSAWREAYNHWGVIPTMGWPDVKMLEKPDGFTKQLLNEINYYQQNRLDPNFDGEWPASTIMPYQGASNLHARYVKDSGWKLVEDTTGKIIAQTVSGVSEIAGTGSIENWMVYDADKIMGLNPEMWYPYQLNVARNLNAFHVSSLPKSIQVDRVSESNLGLTIATSTSDDAAMWISELMPAGRCGYVLDNGYRFEAPGIMWSSPSGAIFTAANQRNLQAHPPWQGEFRDAGTGEMVAGGTGYVYMAVELDLPAITGEGQIRFCSEVAMDINAVGKEYSDGVLFAVQVTCGDQVKRAEVINATAGNLPLELNMTEFAGKRVELRLESDPGPARVPSFDWARWYNVRVETDIKQQGTLRFVTNENWQLALSSKDTGKLNPVNDNEYEVSLTLPGTLFLLHENPETVQAPVNLSTRHFDKTIISHTGAQLFNAQYSEAIPGDVDAAGVARKGVHTHPPSEGAILMDYAMQLPETPLKFQAIVGLRDNSESEGIIYMVLVNGKEIARQRIMPDENWIPLEADLSPWAGQPVVLSLVTDSEKSFAFDWGYWDNPVLVNVE